MANPRQRRKAKSSTYKAISHAKRAKRLQKKMPAIRGPKALQDAWDPSKTLRQNYLALGLQHDLNPIPSGGCEVNHNRTTDQNNTSRPPPTASCSIIDDARSSGCEGPTVTSALPKGFGRIVRDSSGNIVRVELPIDGEAGDASKRELAIDAPVITTESELRIWACRPETSWGTGSEGMDDTIVQGQLSICSGPRSTSNFDDMRFKLTHRELLTNGPVDLENFAASATVRERHTSSGERLYLERLVKKYGDDPHRMARDRRLNPEQRTANELRRAIVKAGGFGVLREGTDTKVAG